MKKKITLQAVLYLLTAICFIIAAITEKIYYFIPIGCCFFILGITNWSGKSDGQNKDDK